MSIHLTVKDSGTGFDREAAIEEHWAWPHEHAGAPEVVVERFQWNRSPTWYHHLRSRSFHFSRDSALAAG